MPLPDTAHASLRHPPEPVHDHLAALLSRRPGGDPRAVHGAAAKLGCLASTFLCNHALLSYLRRGLLVGARKLFDEMRHPNVVSWSVLISGCTQLGSLRDAFLLFLRMLRHGGSDRPNSFTVGSLVTGCARSKDIAAGAQVHASVVKIGVDGDMFVAGTLADMYAKCGCVDTSWRVFKLMPQKSVVSWTSMISCLVNHGSARYHDMAMVLFKKMIFLKVWPTILTFSCVLKVFDVPEMLHNGKQVHCWLVKLGTEVDPALSTALMAMYGRCGGLDEIPRLACRMSHDNMSRTVLLGAYAHNGYNKEAIDVFREMVTGKVVIDQCIMTTVMRACSLLGQLKMGKEIHCYALKNFSKLDTLMENAIVTVYSRCGEITSAEIVFGVMENKDSVSWTALLSGYGQNGLGKDALLFFRKLLREGLSSPVFCVTSALRACSTTTNLVTGQQIHSRAVKLGIDDDNSVANALITMYARCGNVRVAMKIFNSMSSRGIVSWNALITSFSQHGNEAAAVQLFHLMQEEGVRPDDYTFVGLLTSCSRMGLVAEGCGYFQQMTVKYNVEPKMEHYTCMVDLFARAGRFRDAMEFIDAMPCRPDRLVWEALLASCKTHGNVELGRVAAKKILEIRPDDPSPYITLSNIHASIDMWDKKAWNRALMDYRGVRKHTGSSWVNTEVFSEDIFDALQVGVT